MTPDPDRIIRRIAAATRGTPYEGRIYSVGGFLRDRLLGRAWSGDLDFVVEGDAGALAAALFERGISSSAPVLYPRFGTAMLRVDEVDVELVTARQESYEANSRKPAVSASTVRQDALRRDFTINTLLQQIHTGDITDPTGCARDDIASGVLRTPLDPDRTFSDDPLRMLRAVRFSAQLGFEIDPETAVSIRRCSARLGIISGERIRDEFNKTLLSARPSQGLRNLLELDLLDRFLPELRVITGDVSAGTGLWGHTLALTARLAGTCKLPLMLASCLHHACEPAQVAGPLRRLRYSNDDSRATVLLLELRQALQKADVSLWTDGRVRRFVRKSGAYRGAAMDLAQADRDTGDPLLAGVDLESMAARIADLEACHASQELESPLDGGAIMELLNVPAGPSVRHAKELLLEEVLEGRMLPNDAAAARQFLLKKNAGG